MNEIRNNILGELKLSSIPLSALEISNILDIKMKTAVQNLESLQCELLVDKFDGRWFCTNKFKEQEITKPEPEVPVRKSHNDTSIEIVDIDPEMAKDLLSRNNTEDAINRPLKKAVVDNYAHQMKQGKWGFNGEGISIGKSGRLLNGQHRLSAVVQSGVTVKMLVCLDVDDSMFSSYDQGSVRTGKDVLIIKGYAPRKATIMATMIRLNLLFRTTGSIDRCASFSKRFTNDDILVEEKSDKDYSKAADYIMQYKSHNLLAPAGHLAFVVYRTFKIDRIFSAPWMKGLIQGTGLTENDLRLWIKDYFYREKNSIRTVSNHDKTKLIVKAWHYMRKDIKAQTEKNFFVIRKNTLVPLHFDSDNWLVK